MTKLLGIILSGLILLGGGVGTGWVAARHLDPLRQDSTYMEQWFQANIRGDAETMYRLSSPDIQQQMGHDDFIKEFSHPPSDTPPAITFQASVKLAGYGSELFYDVAIFDGKKIQHATISVYVDDDGKFEFFAG